MTHLEKCVVWCIEFGFIAPTIPFSVQVGPSPFQIQHCQFQIQDSPDQSSNLQFFPKAPLRSLLVRFSKVNQFWNETLLLISKWVYF